MNQKEEIETLKTRVQLLEKVIKELEQKMKDLEFYSRTHSPNRVT